MILNVSAIEFPHCIDTAKYSNGSIWFLSETWNNLDSTRLFRDTILALYVKTTVKYKAGFVRYDDYANVCVPRGQIDYDMGWAPSCRGGSGNKQSKIIDSAISNPKTIMFSSQFSHKLRFE